MTSVRELPPSVVIPKNIEIGYWAKVAQGRIGSEQDERKRREGKKKEATYTVIPPTEYASSSCTVSDFIRVIDELL